MKPACQETSKKESMYVSTISKAHSLHPVQAWIPLYSLGQTTYVKNCASVIFIGHIGSSAMMECFSGSMYLLYFTEYQNTEGMDGSSKAGNDILWQFVPPYKTFLFVSCSSPQRKMIMLQLSLLHQQMTSAQPVMAIRALCALVELDVAWWHRHICLSCSCLQYSASGSTYTDQLNPLSRKGMFVSSTEGTSISTQYTAGLFATHINLNT